MYIRSMCAIKTNVSFFSLETLTQCVVWVYTSAIDITLYKYVPICVHCYSIAVIYCSKE